MDLDEYSFSSDNIPTLPDPPEEISLPSNIQDNSLYTQLSYDYNTNSILSRRETLDSDSNDDGSVKFIPLRLAGTTILHFEFDPEVIEYFRDRETPTVFLTADSESTVTTIYSNEIFDTVAHEIPTTDNERLHYYSRTINAPPPEESRFISVPQAFTINNSITEDSTGIYPTCYVQGGSLRRNIERATREKPSKNYTGTKYSFVKPGFHCCTVENIVKESLFVPQIIKTVVFSTATTYYSTYKENSEDYKYKLFKELPTSKIVKAPITYRKQYRSAFYYHSNGYAGTIGGSLHVVPRFYKHRRSIQATGRRGKFELHKDIPGNRIVHGIQVDQILPYDKIKKKAKYISPTPVTLRTPPDHPLIISFDNPDFLTRLRSNHFYQYRGFDVPRERWSGTPVWARTPYDHQQARYWLYQQLLTNWAPME